MRAFVTGGTGFLGGSLVRQLTEQGHSVTALVRSRAKAAATIGGTPAALVEGDLSDVAGFAPALAGHDIVFHTAAYFREYFQPGDHWATLKRLNVDATIAILRAAEQHGVRRVIHTSSGGVIGMRAGQTWGDESDPPDAIALRNLYFRSKALAEQEIAQFLKESRLDVILALPGWMWGPGDSAPTSSGQIVRDFMDRKLPGIIPGGGAPCDVRDVAQGMILAAERGRSGERYILGGDQWVSLADILTGLEQVSGIPAPRVRLPFPLAISVAFLSEIQGRLTGKPVLATIEGLRTLQHRRTTRSQKAIRELGASFRPLIETLRDEVDWYRAHTASSPQLTGAT
jgi:dihydroflavonol-4-reductase